LQVQREREREVWNFILLYMKKGKEVVGEERELKVVTES
jgi:hypothetical protein